MSAPRRTQRARRFLGRFIAFCGGAGVWECDSNIIFDCSALGFEGLQPECCGAGAGMPGISKDGAGRRVEGRAVGLGEEGAGTLN
ncbi:MAG: hypothetical protein O8C66_08125 [Candidatus Methanoperedens sp.]|nr:hypothetical protein [Candidatus Methanoperedens sp.]MCZ7370462.1 hypothetical protein [Candidatus Methanoperedens sp.]